MKHDSPLQMVCVAVLAAVTLSVGVAGCASKLQAPAAASVAVSGAAVEDAASAEGGQFAPLEMAAARDKLAQARRAMADKEYKFAIDLATQAQADAKLAQSKANSAKAQTAADALQDDIRVLREELDRANAPKPQ